MASIETRTSKDNKTTYRVKVRLKGYPEQSATFSVLDEAEAWADSVETDIRAGKFQQVVGGRGRKVKDLIDRYINEILPNYSEQEQQNRAKRLLWWRKELGNLSLSKFVSQSITDKKDKLDVAPATVEKYLKNLSHVCSMGVNRWDWLEYNPLNKVKSPKIPMGRVRFLSDSERSRLLQACQKSKDKFLYICVTLALSTGLRQGELMSLEWKDVDLTERTLTITNKNKHLRRKVPIEGHGLALLRGYSNVRRKDTELLFPSKKSNKPKDLRKEFQIALGQAGIKNFRWNDLRHCKAIKLAMSGSTLPQIAEVMGYTSLTMAKRYEHLSKERVSSVVQSLAKRIY